MDDIKKGLREAEETSKEAWRKRDGEDLADKVGNAGDDVRKELGNLGDKVDDVVDEAADKVEDVADRSDDARPLDRGY